MQIFFDPKVIKKILDLTSLHSEELGGLLIGRRKKDFLLITDAVTPVQESSAVSVRLNTHSQISILEKIRASKNGDLICGWFHSHPGMGADFMSETDIRTQTTYQSLYDDSVAIIVDPSEYFKKKKLTRKALSAYKVKNRVPVEIDLKTTLTAKDALEFYLRIGEKELSDVKPPSQTSIITQLINAEQLKELRDQLITAVLGWNLIVIIIIIIVLSILVS